MDENVLKAVNSMKRGKKHGDDFDREFNQLRITNPQACPTAKKKKDNDRDPIIEDAVDTATTAVDNAAVSRPWEAIDDLGDVGLWEKLYSRRRDGRRTAHCELYIDRANPRRCPSRVGWQTEL